MVPGKPGVGEGEASGQREARYREIIASRSDPSTLYSLLGMRLEELGEGTARFVLPIASRLFNAGGVVHGGVMASIADAAVAAALATLIDPAREMMATVEMKINYIAAVRGGELVCEARIIQKGRAVAVGEASVYSGEGKLLAKAMATFIVRSKDSV
ncbi:MAG: PaaI family thioesterase [Actinobacteria bacterium]|nr:PaaI family thioesterase [Actinomycetota bacterium]